MDLKFIISESFKKANIYLILLALFFTFYKNYELKELLIAADKFTFIAFVILLICSQISLKKGMVPHYLLVYLIFFAINQFSIFLINLFILNTNIITGLIIQSLIFYNIYYIIKNIEKK